MTLDEALFWLESIRYDDELTAEAFKKGSSESESDSELETGPDSTTPHALSLMDLAATLPETKKLEAKKKRSSR